LLGKVSTYRPLSKHYEIPPPLHYSSDLRPFCPPTFGTGSRPASTTGFGYTSRHAAGSTNFVGTSSNSGFSVGYSVTFACAFALCPGSSAKCPTAFRVTDKHSNTR